jgi:hypothetical protein
MNVSVIRQKRERNLKVIFFFFFFVSKSKKKKRLAFNYKRDDGKEKGIRIISFDSFQIRVLMKGRYF